MGRLEMARTDQGELANQILAFSPEELDRRPVEATADIRRVGLTERPDIVAVRYYFQEEERLFRLAEPDSRALQDLREALSFISTLVLDAPLTYPPGNRLDLALSRHVDDLLGQETGKHDDGANDMVTEIWKAWQSLSYVTFTLVSCGFIALTPAARPLIQLAIEVQDLLFGRRDGSLLRARLIVRAARRAGNSQKELGEPNPCITYTGIQLTPFQKVFNILAVSASQIDVDDDALWLQACSQALAAAIEYLRTQNFLPVVLKPIVLLHEALCRELAGKESNLFKEHFVSRHGPELSPRRAPRLHRHFTDRLIVNAWEQFRLARRSGKLTKYWFDDQLRMIGLRNETGMMVTSSWVKRLDRRQSDNPGPSSGLFRFREATNLASRSVLGGFGIVGKHTHPSSYTWQKGDKEQPVAVPPTFQVGTLLQTALLYEPRHLPKESRRSRAPKQTSTMIADELS